MQNAICSPLVSLNTIGVHRFSLFRLQEIAELNAAPFRLGAVLSRVTHVSVRPFRMGTLLCPDICDRGVDAHTLFLESLESSDDIRGALSTRRTSSSESSAGGCRPACV